MIPREFNNHGLLERDCEATFTELRKSILVLGPDPAPPLWEQDWRETLVGNLEVLVQQLWAAGIKTIYINGSFVTADKHPRDIDACFECDYMEWKSGELEKRLNAAAPKKIWTWNESDMKSVLGIPKLPMWISYRVELFSFCSDQAIGLQNVSGKFLSFPEAYRFTRSGLRKGIVLLKEDYK